MAAEDYYDILGIPRNADERRSRRLTATLPENIIPMSAKNPGQRTASKK